MELHCKKQPKVINYLCEKTLLYKFDWVVNTALHRGNIVCIECEKLLLLSTFNWVTDETSKEILKELVNVFSVWTLKN